MITRARLERLHSNERGMALVTALLILVALTLIGVTAMTNTTIDTMIAGNDRQAQQKFYATEGAEELALAALPDLISGLTKCYDSYGSPITCNDQNGNPIKTIDQLLRYDGDGDTIPDGNITAVLNAYLNTPDFFSVYCQAPSSKDPLTDAVLIRDDDDGDNNLFHDSNKEVLLTISPTDPVTGKALTDPVTGKPIDLVRYKLKRLLIKHDGAVSLIDKDGGVSITMKPNTLVDGDGGKNSGKEGIVTTDMLSDFSSLSSQVKPHGVVQGFDQFINPGIKDLHDVMSLLRQNTPLSGSGSSITIGTNKSDDVQIPKKNANKPEIIRVQGNVTIRSDLTNKVLIVQDYRTPGTSSYDCGITIKEKKKFDGLIILLPSHDVAKTVQITLEDSAVIAGAIIASSIYDPNNPQAAPGIDLTLNGKAKITYDYSKIISTGYERQFAVLKRDYSPITP